MRRIRRLSKLDEQEAILRQQGYNEGDKDAKKWAAGYYGERINRLQQALQEQRTNAALDKMRAVQQILEAIGNSLRTTAHIPAQEALQPASEAVFRNLQNQEAPWKTSST